MNSVRRAGFTAFAAACLLGLAWGCSAADNSPASRAGAGGTTSVTDGGNDEYVLRPDGNPDQAGESGLKLNPLCGKKPVCVPDDPNACVGYVAPSAGASAGGATGGSAPTGFGGQSPNAGGLGDGGAAGEPSFGGGGTGGAIAGGGAAGEGGASEAGAAGQPIGAGGAAESPTYGCQVQLVTVGTSSTLTSQCAPAGTGATDAPCISSADCAAGLGCVGDQTSGLCEPFCCSGDTLSCGTGTYCAERTLRDARASNTSSAAAPLVPVCVPAQNCDLSVPYPCTGAQCQCQNGTACLVVRSDGTTTCAMPGAGKAGDACPCAWGLVCSAATKQCVTLCYTRGAATCGTGKCQASADLPDGFGVCVGGSDSG